MNHLILKPGQILWYCDRTTGDLGTVQVKNSYPGEFVISYKGKLHRLPFSALGTRLFFTRKGAACPSGILKDRAKRENLTRLKADNDIRGISSLYEDLEPFDDDRQDYQKNYYDYTVKDSGEIVDDEFSLSSWLEEQNKVDWSRLTSEK